MASIIDSTADAIVSINLSCIVTSWNNGAETLYGLSAEEMMGKSIMAIIPNDRHNEELHILGRIKEGETVGHYDTVRKRKDGLLVDISLTVSPIKDLDGTIVGASKIARDITHQKKAAEAEKLLVAELHHRVKNTLATVQAIASQTLETATAEQREAFIARLHALAGAQDALTQDGWSRAPLSVVLNRALEPFQKERISAWGPDVSLSAQQAMIFTMVLHELATNAVKHGALSNATGHVSINWQKIDEAERPRLQLCWKERGGPSVRNPTRKGFGSRMIEASLDKIEVAYAPEGVTCTLELVL